MICLLLGVLLAAEPPHIECKLLDEFANFKTTCTTDSQELWEVVPDDGDLEPWPWLDEDEDIYYIEGEPLSMVPIEISCDMTSTPAAPKN